MMRVLHLSIGLFLLMKMFKSLYDQGSSVAVCHKSSFPVSRFLTLNQMVGKNLIRL